MCFIAVNIIVIISFELINTITWNTRERKKRCTLFVRKHLLRNKMWYEICTRIPNPFVSCTFCVKNEKNDYVRFCFFLLFCVFVFGLIVDNTFGWSAFQAKLNTTQHCFNQCIYVHIWNMCLNVNIDSDHANETRFGSVQW